MHLFGYGRRHYQCLAVRLSLRFGSTVRSACPACQAKLTFAPHRSWFIVRNATEANAARQLLNHHRPSECSNVVHIGVRRFNLLTPSFFGLLLTCVLPLQWNGPPYQAFVGGEYKAVETLAVD